MSYKLDSMLPGGINENDPAFEVSNSEGNKAMISHRKPKDIMFYCPQCSHHYLSTKVPDDWWNARTEKCQNCLGTGERCTKCDEGDRVRRAKREAA